MLRRISTWLTVFLLILLLGPANLPGGDQLNRIRRYTRPLEFDYATWTWDALWVKWSQVALNLPAYMDAKSQHDAVLEYFNLVGQIRQQESSLQTILADQDQSLVEENAGPVRAELEALYAQRALAGPLAESILQNMLSSVVVDTGLGLGGQPIPPVMYRNTPLPWALIVSRRESIGQIQNISLATETNLDDHIQLEDEVANELDVSTLVVPVGGVGAYPTMVIESTNSRFIMNVVAHEWAHNYLTWHPAGALYNSAPEMRTINETAASIAENEWGAALLEHFFPELVPPLPPPPAPPADNQPEEESPPPGPPPFDYRAEMHSTRLTVDALLEAGKIEQAEAYMEVRRQFFWENGYHIRKLNQAFFAFYGSYADVPGGAAGADPVGAAVRELRAQSSSLLDFLQRLAWVTSWEDLQARLAQGGK